MTPSNRGIFIRFYTAKVLANLAAFAFLPLLPVILTGRQAGVLQVGFFFSALAIARLAFGLVGGWLADTVGHLRGLALGSVIGVCAFAALAFTHSWGWIYAGMVLIYAASALTTPSQSAFIGSFVRENRGRAFGLMNTIHTAAQMGGPALGGWLAETYGYTTLFQVTGVLYLLAAVIRVHLSRTVPHGVAMGKPALSDLGASLGRMRALIAAGGLLTWMLLADGFGDIAGSLTETYQPIFLENAGLPLLQIGLVGSIGYAAALLSHSLAGYLVDRYGERLPIFLSFALTGLSILGFTFSHTLAGFAASWALMSLMWGLGTTAYDSLISRAVPENQRGLAYGLFSTAQGFFSLPVPALGGWLFLLGPTVPFIAAASVSLLGAALVLRKFPGSESASQRINESAPLIR